MSRVKKFLKNLGPGFITGASDDDPSGIATYSQTGAIFGLTQLWTALFTFPLMTAVQEMCGRIGLVTGKGLSGVMKQHYSRPVVYICVFLLVVANTINIGANLGAMAASANLLVPIPSIIWLFIITFTILVLEIFVSYQTYAKFLKYLALSLLAYVATAFIVKVNWIEVIKATLIPRISLEMSYVINIVAIFGTTISPYLFFWQADEEVEEQIMRGRITSFGKGLPKVTKGDISNLRKDTMIGMFFSNIVMWFIIITTGTVLHVNGTIIETPHDAAEALRPFAGDFAFVLFAAGIIGTGLLAVPVLSGSAAYAVSEALNLKTGLNLKFKKAYGFYGVIIVATLVGVLVNFLGIPSMKMLYYSAVINGLIAPVLLVMILLIANNKKIMNIRTNSRLQNILGVTTIVVMSVAGAILIYDLLK